MSYYFVKDELRTITIGPVTVQKNQTATLKPDQPAKAGGSLAILARGADKKLEVSFGALGSLTTDKPFLGEVLDAAKAAQLNAGITISTNADASVVAFYTPPRA